jgi:hypothetical protein
MYNRSFAIRRHLHGSCIKGLLAVSFPTRVLLRSYLFAVCVEWCTACGKRRSRLRRKPGTARSTTFDTCCWREGTSCNRPLMYIPRSSHCAHPHLSAVLSLSSLSLSLQLSDQAEQEEEEDSIAQREMTWPYSFSDKRPNISLGTLRSSFAHTSAPVSQPSLSCAEVESRPVAPPNKWSPEATLRPHKETGDQSASSYDHGRVNLTDKRSLR